MDDRLSTEEKVKSLIAEQLGVRKERVTSEARLKEDLGSDSLDAIELVMVIEDAFNIEIPDEDAGKLTTVKDIVLYITAKVEGA